MSATRNAAFGLAMVMAASAPARADNVDVAALVASQVSSKAASIYQQKFGKPMPAGTTLGVAFQGSVSQVAVEFAAPAAIPQRSLVKLQGTLANCDGARPTQRIAFTQPTFQEESWRPLDNIAGATPARASLASPPNSGFESPPTPLLREWNQPAESKLPLAWNAATDVQVASGRSVNVQFVVDEITVETTYRTAFAAAGKTTLTFDRAAVSGATVAWTRPRPASPLPGGASGRDRYVCRANLWPNYLKYAGEVRGNLCMVVASGKEYGASEFEWLDANWGTMRQDCREECPFGGCGPFTRARKVCDPEYPVWGALQWADGASSGATTTRAADIPLVTHTTICRALPPNEQREWVVGWLEGNRCHIFANGREHVQDRFQTLNQRNAVTPEHTVLDVNLEDVLPAAERTFVVRGTYKGVTTLQGDFRVATPRVSACEVSAAGKAPAASGDAARGVQEPPLPASAAVSQRMRPKGPGT